jgi:hypothetical protein
MDPVCIQVVIGAIGFTAEVFSLFQMLRGKRPDGAAGGDTQRLEQLAQGFVKESVGQLSFLIDELQQDLLKENLFDAVNGLRSEITVLGRLIQEPGPPAGDRRQLVLISLKDTEQKLEECRAKLERHNLGAVWDYCNLVASTALLSGYTCLSIDTTERQKALELNLHETRQRLAEAELGLTYNVLVLGFTGAGKTSLINYLYECDVRTSGIPRPVTTCFEPVDIIKRGLPVRIFEARGFQARTNDAEKWLTELDRELAGRGTDRTVEDWFHTVLWCHEGTQLSDLEVEIIKDRLLVKDYPLGVVFTHSDQRTEQQDALLTDNVRARLGPSVWSVHVSSTGDEPTGRMKSTATARADVEEQIYRDFWRSIRRRLPRRSMAVLGAVVDQWTDTQKRFTRELIESGKSQGEVSARLKVSTETFARGLEGPECAIKTLVNHEIRQTLMLYGVCSSRLRYPPSSPNEADNTGVECQFASLASHGILDVVAEIFDFGNLWSAGLQRWLGDVTAAFDRDREGPVDWQDALDRDIDGAAANLKAALQPIRLKIEGVLADREAEIEQGLYRGGARMLAAGP